MMKKPSNLGSTLLSLSLLVGSTLFSPSWGMLVNDTDQASGKPPKTLKELRTHFCQEIAETAIKCHINNERDCLKNISNGIGKQGFFFDSRANHEKVEYSFYVRIPVSFFKQIGDVPLDTLAANYKKEKQLAWALYDSLWRQYVDLGKRGVAPCSNKIVSQKLDFTYPQKFELHPTEDLKQNDARLERNFYIYCRAALEKSIESIDLNTQVKAENDFRIKFCMILNALNEMTPEAPLPAEIKQLIILDTYH